MEDDDEIVAVKIENRRIKKVSDVFFKPTQKNATEYYVIWSDGSESWEKHADILDDYIQLVK
jgi:hypothetical protein